MTSSTPISSDSSQSRLSYTSPTSITVSSEISTIQYSGNSQSSSYFLYRPISLLPILSIIFENIPRKCLLPFLNSHNLIPMRQFGFCSQHSTIATISSPSSLEQKEYCMCAFLDVPQSIQPSLAYFLNAKPIEHPVPHLLLLPL